MLGLERERLREVALEVVGALARDAVDEIERDVVEPGVAKTCTARADVLGPRAALEHVEQVRLEALRAERDAVDAVLAQQRARAPASPSPGSPRP